MSAVSVTRSRVVPGIGVTIARPARSSALNRLDLPTFGLPPIATRAPSRISRPRLASQSSVAELALDRSQRRARFACLDEVIALVRKIERRLELRGQIEQLGVDLGDALGQRAFELIERRARLQRRDRVDEIGDRLGLHEIDPAVEKRAQRELAGLGEPRAQRRSPARRSACSTTGLPCALISTTCSPV